MGQTGQVTDGRGEARASVHSSAGRRRWQALRRTVAATATVVVVGAAAWAYAGSRSRADDPDRTSVVGAGSAVTPTASPTTAPEATPAPQSTEPQAVAPNETPAPQAAKRPAPAFAPVVTDEIPAPTTSIALSAPVPGTTNMQASAAAAFDAARAAAAKKGVTIGIRSAWRSAAYQQILFDRSVGTYGSKAEAGKWVLSPKKSAHVKGYAVDVQPQAAGTWLEANGARYGLCRTYENEWWHFEYLATSDCPAMKPSALG